MEKKKIKKIEQNLNIIRNCSHVHNNYSVIISTYKSSRYPYFYPRDVNCIGRTLGIAAEKGVFVEPAKKMLEGTADFFLRTQKNGHWGQKYDEKGHDVSLYKQEDNTAHGIAFLANYLLVMKKLRVEVDNEKKIIDAALKAYKAAYKDFFDEKIGLFYSTTSIHEFSIETGYTLWTNSSYAYALQLLEKVTSEKEEIRKRRKELFKNIKKKLFEEGRFIARIDGCDGRDLRADVTLLSPFYFGFADAKKNLKTIKFVQEKLEDKNLGLIHRFNSTIGDGKMHNHAGIGPWLQYSAILAQCFFKAGKRKEAQRIIKKIDYFRSENDYLPEHVATKKSFSDFWEKEWLSGLDFEKEFDKNILLYEIDFDRIADEVFLMARSYRKIKENYLKHEREYIRFGLPLAWTHAEYACALLMAEGN